MVSNVSDNVFCTYTDFKKIYIYILVIIRDIPHA